MTIKMVTVKDMYSNSIGHGNFNDAYGGRDLTIYVNHNFQKIEELIDWWQEWQPVFSSMNPHVQEALQQAKVMHALSKDSNG